MQQLTCDLYPIQLAQLGLTWRDVFCGLRTRAENNFMAGNALFFANTLHVQQLSNKMNILLLYQLCRH